MRLGSIRVFCLGYQSTSLVLYYIVLLYNHGTLSTVSLFVHTKLSYVYVCLSQINVVNTETLQSLKDGEL